MGAFLWANRRSAETSKAAPDDARQRKGTRENVRKGGIGISKGRYHLKNFLISAKHSRCTSILNHSDGWRMHQNGICGAIFK